MLNGTILNGGSQPPRNRIVVIAHIKNVAANSPKKYNINSVEEYSVWYPATNSASASGKSNGGLFVSARAEIKNITNIGNKGKTNQIFFWAITISDKLRDPTQRRTVIITKPIDTS